MEVGPSFLGLGWPFPLLGRGWPFPLLGRGWLGLALPVGLAFPLSGLGLPLRVGVGPSGRGWPGPDPAQKERMERAKPDPEGADQA